MTMKWIALSLSLRKRGRDYVSKKVSVDNFADALLDILSEYTKEVEEGMEEAKEENAKKGVKLLRDTSPVGRRKKYYRGWRAKKIGTAWVVHNATDYQLTHLLEKGHAKVNGGRVDGIPHIGPAEEVIIVGYEKQLEKIIKGG